MDEIPIHDIPQVASDDSGNITIIVVIPLLRPYTNPLFDTVGKVVQCFRQLFEVR